MLTPLLRRPGGDPWFRRRPVLVLGVAGVLYLAVFVLRVSMGDAEDAYSMLYVFPVALVATAFGARAGALAGLLAVVLMVVWAVVRDVSLDPTGWLSRIVPVLLLGVLLGSAADRERRAEEERRRLEAAALLHREAIEINDSLVQGMAAAKWALDSGEPEAGARILGETLARAHELVSGLISRAGMGDRAEDLSEPPAR